MKPGLNPRYEKIALTILILLTIMIPMIGCKDMAAPDRERLLDIAGALEARGLYGAALGELDRYREAAGSGLSRDDEADLLYRMGKMADDNLGDCERALKYYTMADALRPDAPWSRESGKRSVVCLEKLGRSRDSNALLKQITGGDASGEDESASDPVDDTPVVATIDGRSVTWAEVESVMKYTLKGDGPAELDERRRMVNDYMVRLMIYDDAVRKGYDSDASAQKRMDWARKDGLVAHYLDIELADPGDDKALQALIKELAGLHEVRIFDGSVPAP